MNFQNIYIHIFLYNILGDIIGKIDNTIFKEQFVIINDELGPAILKVVEENSISDNVILFYFATLVKEGLKDMEDKQMKEAVLRFMFDE